MKTVSRLVIAFCLLSWAFVNLVSNTQIFKQADVAQERIWISANMVLTGIVPLCIAIWLVLTSGLFPSRPNHQEYEGQANEIDHSMRRGRRGRN